MSSIKTLLETMRMLRDKDNGCPWDIEQTLESLSPCVVEEAYEVSDAIANKDYENLKNQIDGDKGKLIGFLFVGLIIGRIYEKLRFTKKRIFRRFK